MFIYNALQAAHFLSGGWRAPIGGEFQAVLVVFGHGHSAGGGIVFFIPGCQKFAKLTGCFVRRIALPERQASEVTKRLRQAAAPNRFLRTKRGAGARARGKSS
jgi:hypothetical protein